MIVLVEQALVVAIGMALGSWLGVRLTELIMPFLGLNEAGLRVLPPFRAAMDWQVIAVVYGLMLTAFTATTLILAGVFSRTAIQRALRFGEA
jgi:large-conductance mechanosensitive channel